MARQVDIQMSLSDKKVISSLEAIRNKFQALRLEKEKLAPNGKMQVDVDTKSFNSSISDIKNFKTSVNQMNTAMSKVKTSSSNLNKMGTSIGNATSSASEGLKSIPKQADSAEKSINKMGQSFMATALSINLLRKVTTSWVSTFKGLTDASYNIGVAAQLSIGEITKLNTEILNLTRTLSVSPIVFGNAVNELVRTGRTLGDSKEIMKEISKLSIASGEDLAKTAQAVTKIFVSLDIEGSSKRVSDALSTIHSVAIQTASSVGSLAESYKNFAGSLGVLSKSSGQTGEALQDYKQDLLDFALSATGALNNLGLSAS